MCSLGGRDAHCRAMPAMRTEVQITGLRKEGDFSHDPIFNGGHGPRRPAASRPRNARGKERKKKKGERSWGVMTVERRNENRWIRFGWSLKARTVEEKRDGGDSSKRDRRERRLGMLFCRKNSIWILVKDLRIIINNEETIWEGRKRIKVHLFDLKT